MNIYVCMKQVLETEAKIKLNADRSGIDTSNVKWIVSPYDEFAIEEALQLKAKNPGSTVTVLSAGTTRVTDALRSALALGADSGIHVEIPETADSNLVARCLASALKKESSVDIIFTGKEAIDDGAAQVSQLLAEFLDLPHVSTVLNIVYSGTTVQCKREIEGGVIELIESSLPVVIAAQKGLNTPRYASIPNIMQAKKKPIRVFKMAELDIAESEQKIRYKNYQLPPAKQPGKKIEGDLAQQVRELVRLLHDEAKVI